MPCVLIVDDEPFQRLLIRETLAGDPTLTFLEARNAQQALRLAQQAHPDLILLDVLLPDIDGLKVCRQLKADPDLQGITIILITASHNHVTEPGIKACRADDYLPKPFEVTSLQALVSYHLDI